MLKRKTINSAQTLTSKTLHSGEDATLELLPAEAGTGLVIERSDVDKDNRIPIRPQAVAQGDRRTVLTNGTVSVNTIEHLLAALHAYGITDLLIRVDKEELPGCDGSALEFVNALKAGGIQELDATIEPIVITKPITVEAGGGTLSVLPAKSCSVDYTLDYSKHGVGLQHQSFALSAETFSDDIAQCRTFCMKGEWDVRLDHGLGKGATTDSTVVMDGNTPFETALRTDNELSKHKILDILGDLYLLGRPVLGKFIAVKSGHATNVSMVRAIYQQDGPDHLDVNAIKRMLPHRFPLLLVDRITELTPKKEAIGYKNLTYNEHFFQGHFPKRPVMPGVLQVEAMAQLAGSILLHAGTDKPLIPMFTAIEKVKFRRPVVPGDRLDMETKIVKFRRNMGEVEGKAYVDGQLASEALFRFVLVEEQDEA